MPLSSMLVQSRRGSGLLYVLLVAIVVLVFGLIAFWPYMGRRRAEESESAQARAVAMALAQAEALRAQDPSRMAAVALANAAAQAASAAVDQRWDDFLASVQSARDAGPDRLRAFVWTLFTAFDAMQRTDQRRAFNGFFAAGRDLRFSRSFGVGKSGYLTDWPTLRVAIYDYVSQRDPDTARTLASVLLEKRPEEPGEWALALRELARGYPAVEWSDLVKTRLREFMHDRAWGEQGDVSWFEGFDLVAAARSAEFLPDLESVANEGVSRSAQFACFLGADRLMLNEPELTLAALNANQELFSKATGLRAGLFARGDVRRAGELGQLEVYFQREDIGPGERMHFLALFPHRSLAKSENLLSQPPARDYADMRLCIHASLEQVDRWLADERFASWHNGLREATERMRSRLAQ